MPEVRDNQIPPGLFNPPLPQYNQGFTGGSPEIHPSALRHRESSGSSWGWILACILLSILAVGGMLLFPSVMDQHQISLSKTGTSNTLTPGGEPAPSPEAPLTDSANPSPNTPIPIEEPAPPVTPPSIREPQLPAPTPAEEPAACPVTVPPPPVPQATALPTVEIPTTCPVTPPPPVPKPPAPSTGGPAPRPD